MTVKFAQGIIWPMITNHKAIAVATAIELGLFFYYIFPHLTSYHSLSYCPLL